MADNHEPTEQDLEAKGQDPNNGGQDPQPDRQAGPDKSTPDDVVQSELKRAREEAAAARVKLREYEQAEAARKEEEAKKRGEYEQLYGELKSKHAETERELEELRQLKQRVEEESEARRKALLVQLPADMQDAFSTSSEEQLRIVLERIAATGASPEGLRKRARPDGSDDGKGTPPAPKPGEPGWLRATLGQG